MELVAALFVFQKFKHQFRGVSGYLGVHSDPSTAVLLECFRVASEIFHERARECRERGGNVTGLGRFVLEFDSTSRGRKLHREGPLLPSFFHSPKLL